MKLVEHAFDKNDWFLITALIVSYGVMLLLPKKFPLSISILLNLFGIAVASLFDNSIGYRPFDFYDIMDGPGYTFMDLLVYFLYAPFGYFFMYGYSWLHIKKMGTVFYILLFAAASVGFEWLCIRFQVFRYKHGYSIVYSYTIYLFVQASLLMFYGYLKSTPQEKPV